MDEVDEGVAHIRLVLKVNWQVQEVVSALIVPVNFIQESHLLILVGDISDHHCCSQVFSPFNPFNVKVECGILA